MTIKYNLLIHRLIGYRDYVVSVYVQGDDDLKTVVESYLNRPDVDCVEILK